MVAIRATFKNLDAADRAACRISDEVAGACDISLHGDFNTDSTVQAAVAPFASTSGILGLGGVVMNEQLDNTRNFGDREGRLTLRAPEEDTDTVRGIIANAGGYDFGAEKI